VDSDRTDLEDDPVNPSAFEEGSVISNQRYRRAEGRLLFIVKPISLWESVEKAQMENQNENLINLHHSCIATPIGFVLPMESGLSRELQIIRLSSEGCSLAEVLSANPVWWTSTVKAKMIAVLCLAFGLRTVLDCFMVI
jgi:hypothetical protein